MQTSPSPPPTPSHHTNAYKISQLCREISSLSLDVSITLKPVQVIDFKALFREVTERIFTYWSLSKVEKTRKGPFFTDLYG